MEDQENQNQIQNSSPQPAALPEVKTIQSSSRFVAPIVVIIIILAVVGVVFAKKTKHEGEVGGKPEGLNPETAIPQDQAQIERVQDFYPFNSASYVSYFDDETKDITVASSGDFKLIDGSNGKVKFSINAKDFTDVNFSNSVYAAGDVFATNQKEIKRIDPKGNLVDSITDKSGLVIGGNSILLYGDTFNTDLVWIVTGSNLQAYNARTKSFINVAKDVGLLVPSSNYITNVQFTSKYVWFTVTTQGSDTFYKYDRQTSTAKDYTTSQLSGNAGYFSTSQFAATDQYVAAISYDNHILLYDNAKDKWTAVVPNNFSYEDERSSTLGRLVIQGDALLYLINKEKQFYFNVDTSKILKSSISNGAKDWEEVAGVPANFTSHVQSRDGGLWLKTSDDSYTAFDGLALTSDKIVFPKVKDIGEVATAQGEYMYFVYKQGYGRLNLKTGDRTYWLSNPSEDKNYFEYRNIKETPDFIYILEGSTNGYAESLGVVIYRLSKKEGLEVKKIVLEGKQLNGGFSEKEDGTIDVGIGEDGNVLFNSNQKTNTALVSDWDSQSFKPASKKFSAIGLDLLYTPTHAVYPGARKELDGWSFNAIPVLNTSGTTDSNPPLVNFSLIKPDKTNKLYPIKLPKYEGRLYPNGTPSSPEIRSIGFDPSNSDYAWFITSFELVRVNTIDGTFKVFSNIPTGPLAVYPASDKLVITNSSGVYLYKYEELK